MPLATKGEWKVARGAERGPRSKSTIRVSKVEERQSEIENADDETHIKEMDKSINSWNGTLAS